MNILENLRKELIETHLVKPYDQVVIGCSGGPDSMFLLELFRRLEEELSLEIIVAHVNHGVRGEAAKRDADFVQNYCKRYHLSFQLLETNMNEKAKEWKISPEEAGRKLRYDFFHSLIQQGGRIAVAHNLDDQAETVLMRLIRGTGPDGAGGMEVEKGAVIRPLLQTYRRDIVAYLQEKEIPYCIDQTNLETEYTRNYIRRKILPFMKEVNPLTKEALVRYSFLAQKDREYFDHVVEQYINDSVQISKDYIIIDSSIKELPEALSLRVLRKLYETIAGTGKDFTYHHVSLLKEGLSLPSGKVLVFPRNILFTSEFGSFRLSRKVEKDIRQFPLQFGENKTPWGIFTVLKRKEYSSPSEDEAYFSMDLPIKDIVLRTRRPGDWMIPFGKSSKTKVKDIFQSEKTPKSQREIIPFMMYKDRILWIPGVKRSNEFLYTNDEGILIKREVES
ncbi:MAG: tRNA lysidine(34) synthetase TilS [Tissierellia bacterium]|nr:tRNA lysidine(34) synthetase TilS [Tissierellia bacterium]